MNFNVEKNGKNVHFINCDTGDKFDYIDLAEHLYLGEKITIKKYSSDLTKEEKDIINQTIIELNELSKPRKRKKIILQYKEN